MPSLQGRLPLRHSLVSGRGRAHATAGALARDPRLLAALNAATFVALLLQTVGLVHTGGVTGRTAALSDCVGGPCAPQTHPVDIALQARAGRLVWGGWDDRRGKLLAGYAGVRGGTFRQRYPSVRVDDVFDDVAVVTNGRCPAQWKEWSRRAKRAGLGRARAWEVEAHKRISLRNPPLPVRSSVVTDRSAGAHVVVSVLKRQIAYLATHRRIWESVVRSGRHRTLVVDDTVFPTERLLRLLPSLFNQVDQESVASQTGWHMVTFRRKASKGHAGHGNEAVWSANPQYGRPVTVAGPSYGAGMYALSVGGARWLLRHVTEYRAPLDIELALLQREHGSEFVVLSGCNNDERVDFCPEMAADVSVATGRHQFECVWRRLQERRLAALAESSLPQPAVPRGAQ